MSDGVELATDCREAGFMITNSSATTVTMAATAATRAATLNSAARSKPRVRLAGSLITSATSEVGRDREGDPMGWDLAACETDGPSFAALSLNERGA
jgi:hypothetical protein